MSRFRWAPFGLAALTLVAGTSAANAAPALAPAATTTATAITTSRLAGADRYKTAVAISRANFPSALTADDWVVVASGQAFPDALGAGPMAALLGGPLLLVPTTGTLPSAVATELNRLHAGNIIVVGGPGAVSDSMVNQLAKHAPANHTFTIDGANRYDTAAQTTDGFQPPIQGVPVFIASGTTFPDALGGSAAASILGGTLLLTSPTALPSESKAALVRLKPSKVLVLGGTGAVSNTVLTQVKSTVGSSVPVTRLGGTDRYSTAAKVSAATLTSATEVFLASGTSFPDALAGGPVAPGNGGRPLLLTHKDCVPASTLAEIKRLGATHVTALGGTGVVSDAALKLTPC